MKVIHVNTERGWRGGEQQVLYLAEGLRAEGVTQRLICQRGGALAERAQAAGLEVQELALGGYMDFRSSSRIARSARQFGADLLHLHTAQAHAIGVRAARWAGRGRTSSRPRTVISRRVAYSIFRHSFFHLNRIKYTRGVDRILCITAAVRDVLLADGLSPERLVVVPSGIDPQRFENVNDKAAAYRASFDIPADAWVLGSVGALTPEKGHAHLIDAVAQLVEPLPNLYVVIAGTGKLKDALLAQARAAGVADRIRLVGFRNDVPSLLQWFDALAFPSLLEGMGTTLLDALCLALPVVASDTGGIPEIVRDGREGLLVPPGDATALAGGIRRLHDDAASAAALGLAGRRRVLAQFTREVTVAGTLTAYRALLDADAHG